MEEFGCPPVFPGDDEEESEPAVEENSSAQPQLKKKGKLASKSTGKKYQWHIMEALGIPADQIHKFADAQYWLDYFPPLAIVSVAPWFKGSILIMYCNRLI
jgi:leucyl-tRNA synthetase